MSVEENKAVVRRWNEEIVTGGKPEPFDEVLDRNYTNRSGSDSPWSPGMQGLDQAKEIFGQGLRENPTWRVSVDDMIGEGDQVAARLTGFREGKPVYTGIAYYRLSGGKIVDDWFCMTELEA